MSSLKRIKKRKKKRLSKPKNGTARSWTGVGSDRLLDRLQKRLPNCKVEELLAAEVQRVQESCADAVGLTADQIAALIRDHMFQLQRAREPLPPLNLCLPPKMHKPYLGPLFPDALEALAAVQSFADMSCIRATALDEYNKVVEKLGSILTFTSNIWRTVRHTPSGYSVDEVKQHERRMWSQIKVASIHGLHTGSPETRVDPETFANVNCDQNCNGGGICITAKVMFSHVERPSYVDEHGRRRIMTPEIAVATNGTYSAPVFVRLRFTADHVFPGQPMRVYQGKEHLLQVFKLPVMLGSRLGAWCADGVWTGRPSARGCGVGRDFDKQVDRIGAQQCAELPMDVAQCAGLHQGREMTTAFISGGRYKVFVFAQQKATGQMPLQNVRSSSTRDPQTDDVKLTSRGQRTTISTGPGGNSVTTIQNVDSTEFICSPGKGTENPLASAATGNRRPYPFVSNTTKPVKVSNKKCSALEAVGLPSEAVPVNSAVDPSADSLTPGAVDRLRCPKPDADAEDEAALRGQAVHKNSDVRSLQAKRQKLAAAAEESKKAQNSSDSDLSSDDDGAADEGDAKDADVGGAEGGQAVSLECEDDGNCSEASVGLFEGEDEENGDEDDVEADGDEVEDEVDNEDNGDEEEDKDEEDGDQEVEGDSEAEEDDDNDDDDDDDDDDDEEKNEEKGLPETDAQPPKQDSPASKSTVEGESGGDAGKVEAGSAGSAAAQKKGKKNTKAWTHPYSCYGYGVKVQVKLCSANRDDDSETGCAAAERAAQVFLLPRFTPSQRGKVVMREQKQACEDVNAQAVICVSLSLNGPQRVELATLMRALGVEDFVQFELLCTQGASDEERQLYRPLLERCWRRSSQLRRTSDCMAFLGEMVAPGTPVSQVVRRLTQNVKGDCSDMSHKKNAFGACTLKLLRIMFRTHHQRMDTASFTRQTFHSKWHFLSHLSKARSDFLNSLLAYVMTHVGQQVAALDKFVPLLDLRSLSAPFSHLEKTCGSRARSSSKKSGGRAVRKPTDVSSSLRSVNSNVSCDNLAATMACNQSNIGTRRTGLGARHPNTVDGIAHGSLTPDAKALAKNFMCTDGAVSSEVPVAAMSALVAALTRPLHTMPVGGLPLIERTQPLLWKRHGDALRAMAVLRFQGRNPLTPQERQRLEDLVKEWSEKHAPSQPEWVGYFMACSQYDQLNGFVPFLCEPLLEDRAVPNVFSSPKQSALARASRETPDTEAAELAAQRTNASTDFAAGMGGAAAAAAAVALEATGGVKTLADLDKSLVRNQSVYLQARKAVPGADDALKCAKRLRKAQGQRRNNKLSKKMSGMVATRSPTRTGYPTTYPAHSPVTPSYLWDSMPHHLRKPAYDVERPVLVITDREPAGWVESLEELRRCVHALQSNPFYTDFRHVCFNVSEDGRVVEVAAREGRCMQRILPVDFATQRLMVTPAGARALDALNALSLQGMSWSPTCPNTHHRLAEIGRALNKGLLFSWIDGGTASAMRIANTVLDLPDDPRDLPDASRFHGVLCSLSSTRLGSGSTGGGNPLLRDVAGARGVQQAVGGSFAADWACSAGTRNELACKRWNPFTSFRRQLAGSRGASEVMLMTQIRATAHGIEDAMLVNEQTMQSRCARITSLVKSNPTHLTCEEAQVEEWRRRKHRERDPYGCRRQVTKRDVRTGAQLLDAACIRRGGPDAARRVPDLLANGSAAQLKQGVVPGVHAQSLSDAQQLAQNAINGAQPSPAQRLASTKTMNQALLDCDVSVAKRTSHVAPTQGTHFASAQAGFGVLPEWLQDRETRRQAHRRAQIHPLLGLPPIGMYVADAKSPVALLHTASCDGTATDAAVRRADWMQTRVLLDAVKRGVVSLKRGLGGNAAFDAKEALRKLQDRDAQGVLPLEEDDPRSSAEFSCTLTAASALAGKSDMYVADCRVGPTYTMFRDLPSPESNRDRGLTSPVGVDVLLQAVRPATGGDKTTTNFGNKQVITPGAVTQMPIAAGGARVDATRNPSGVASRSITHGQKSIAACATWALSSRPLRTTRQPPNLLSDFDSEPSRPDARKQEISTGAPGPVLERLYRLLRPGSFRVPSAAAEGRARGAVELDPVLASAPPGANLLRLVACSLHHAWRRHIPQEQLTANLLFPLADEFAFGRSSLGWTRRRRRSTRLFVQFMDAVGSGEAHVLADDLASRTTSLENTVAQRLKLAAAVASSVAADAAWVLQKLHPHMRGLQRRSKECVARAAAVARTVALQWAAQALVPLARVTDPLLQFRADLRPPRPFALVEGLVRQTLDPYAHESGYFFLRPAYADDERSWKTTDAAKPLVQTNLDWVRRAARQIVLFESSSGVCTPVLRTAVDREDALCTTDSADAVHLHLRELYRAAATNHVVHPVTGETIHGCSSAFQPLILTLKFAPQQATSTGQPAVSLSGMPMGRAVRCGILVAVTFHLVQMRAAEQSVQLSASPCIAGVCRDCGRIADEYSDGKGFTFRCLSCDKYDVQMRTAVSSVDIPDSAELLRELLRGGRGSSVDPDERRQKSVDEKFQFVVTSRGLMLVVQKLRSDAIGLILKPGPTTRLHPEFFPGELGAVLEAKRRTRRA